MMRRGEWVIGLALVLLAGTGCKSTSRKNHNLKQPTVEEYNLPPADSKLTEGPYYPDQKRQLPGQQKEQEKVLGMGGRAGGGLGGNGSPGGGGPTGAPGLGR